MASVLHIAVRVRDMTAQGLRSVHRQMQRAERRIQGMWRRAGSDAGNAFSQALNGSIGSALSVVARNPILATIAAAIVAAIGGIIGAGLAAAIVLALGGAVAGIGILLAAQSEEVKKKWGASLKEVKQLFTDAAKPMLPVIEEARNKMMRLARDWAPHFQAALASMQGPISIFMDSFDRGLRQLMLRAGPSITEGFNTFMVAFGPQFEHFMQGLGDALGALGRTVRDNSTEIAIAFRMILGLITTCIDVINFLANVWVREFHMMIAAVAGVVDGIKMLVDACFSGFAMILTAADKGLSWIPGIGSSITDARRQFDNFRNGVVNDLDQTADRIRGVSETIKQTNQRNKLTADISNLESKVRLAKARLRETNNVKVKAKIRAEISDLVAKVRAAKVQLAMLRDKVVNVTIRNLYDSSGNRTHNLGNGSVGRAMGGVIGAATGGARSRFTMVGEHGPELVNLPAGSSVRSNPDTRRLMAGAGGGSGEAVPIIIQLGDYQIAELLVDPFRRVVSRRGGVEATFGKL